MERSEINNDLTRSEPIGEVRQTKDTRTGQAIQKKSVAELERRLSHKKKEDGRNKKDEIILHEDEQSKKDEKHNDDKKGKGRREKSKSPAPSPGGRKGNEIDYLA